MLSAVLLSVGTCGPPHTHSDSLLSRHKAEREVHTLHYLHYYAYADTLTVIIIVSSSCLFIGNPTSNDIRSYKYVDSSAIIYCHYNLAVGLDSFIRYFLGMSVNVFNSYVKKTSLLQQQKHQKFLGPYTFSAVRKLAKVYV